jgi:ketosteroid isomerase-like protein
VSRENVELLREMYRRRSLAEFADSLHSEAELHQARAIPDTDAYYGREEFVRGVSLWLEEWETFRYIPEDVIDLGQRAFMRVRLSGRAKASGIKLDQTIFHLWTFRGGMPWRCNVFFEEQPALQAAGLSE